MKTTTFILACALTLSATPRAAAQSASQLLGDEKIELTPFIGFRTGGGFTVGDSGAGFDIGDSTSYGGLVDFNLNKNNFKLELLYSHQSSDVDTKGLIPIELSDLTVDYYQAGALQEVGDPKSRLFVSVLLGATRFAPASFDSTTKFSASIGGGLKLLPSRHVGLRFDARGYVTFVNGSSGVFCTGGTCLLRYSGSVLWQGDFTGGLILAF